MSVPHLVLMCLFYLWIPFALYGWYRSSKDKTSSSAPAAASLITLNSAIAYALAFNIIFFIQELFLALGKYWLGLKAVLYHNNHNWYGEHPQDDLAQGYGAVSIFVLGILFSLWFLRIRRSRSWFRLFIFWLAFQGLMQSIPQFATAIVDRGTDTGQAFTYLGGSDALGYVLLICGSVLMVLINLRCSRFLLEMSPSTQHVSHGYRRFSYLFRAALLPALIGIILIFPFRIMPLDRALAPVIVTMVSVPWVFANAWRVKNVNAVGNFANSRIYWIPIVALLVLLIIFQFVLAPGIVFQP